MFMLKYRRENDPVQRKKVKKKILLCINLSVRIQMDKDRPVRKNISLENMTFMFSKDFLCLL